VTVFFNTLHESQLGYAAIFVCVGTGFCFLRQVDKGEVGPGYWAVSFFLNSLGFLCWSGVLPMADWQYYLLGEVLHVAGFFFLACGVYRFTGNEYKKWNWAFLLAWAAIWIYAILTGRRNELLTTIVIRGLRAVLFIAAGLFILRSIPRGTIGGSRLAGGSLVAWGLYILVYAYFKWESLKNLAYGFLVGFQILAAVGMFVMVVGRTRQRAEEDEQQIMRLEGLLPICAYCKKIRDEHEQWQTMELYIEEHSTAEFSHGICPDCMKKHHPDSKA